jgi:hypothetical protein
MTIGEQIRQIMLSEELSGADKLDRSAALIPVDAFKIDNLNKVTPAQLKQLKDGFSNYSSDATDQACRTTGKRIAAAWGSTVSGYVRTKYSKVET